MARQCTVCGAVYESNDAAYCNACGSEDLQPVVDVPRVAAPQRRLRDDPYGVIAAAVLWISGVLYVVGQREPRSWGPLLFTWGSLFIMSTIAGLILRNVRAFTLFAAVGALFIFLYGLVKIG